MFSGTLSVFEKHFLNNWDEEPLRGKKYGVLMSSKTTFDGPTATEGHTLDNRYEKKNMKLFFIAKSPFKQKEEITHSIFI